MAMSHVQSFQSIFFLFGELFYYFLKNKQSVCTGLTLNKIPRNMVVIFAIFYYPKQLSQEKCLDYLLFFFSLVD